MKKNKGDNRLLCYIGLVILIILLLLPPALRLFGKNLYVKEPVKKDEILILSCNKQNESINATFLNKEPQYIDYIIKGDYSVNTNEENETIEQTETTNETPIMTIFKPYAKINYDSKEGKTTFKVAANDLKQYRDYVILFSTLENQQNYYVSQAFYCATVTYSSFSTIVILHYIVEI